MEAPGGIGPAALYGDVLHAGVVPRCSFPDKQLYRHHNEVPAMPPRASAGPMGWVERCDTLRARARTLGRSRCARRTVLAPPVHSAPMARAPRVRTMALLCRRCRIGSSFPGILTRPAASDIVCDAHTRRGSDSKLPGIFRAETGFSCPTHAHRTGPRKAARDRAEPAGQKAHACAHLQARRARRVPFAPSARPSRSDDRVDGVHDDIALLVLLLERLELPNGCLTALRHTAYEHVQCVSAADA